MRYGEAMPGQPSAREKILLAFERLLIDEGERAATLDAVAGAAGVSKGGLLYHFKSKEALTSGLIAKLRMLAEADYEAMKAAPDGRAAYYIRSSVYEDTDFDRTLIAATRLHHGQDPQSRDALQELQRTWYELILEEVRDPAVARAILLMGDGLYYNAILAGGWPEAQAGKPEATIQDLLGVVQTLVGQAAKPNT
jgi:AcrR family transcriptional regulator